MAFIAGEGGPQRPTPFSVYIPFWTEKNTPYQIPCIVKWCPFHILSLELATLLTAVNALCSLKI